MNSSAISTQHVSEEEREYFSYGRCMWLALAIHDCTGWPLEVLMDEGGWIEHAWVRMPDGKSLDVAGIGGAEDFIVDPNLVCPVSRQQLIDLAGGQVDVHALERAREVIKRMGIGDLPADSSPRPLRWKRK